MLIKTRIEVSKVLDISKLLTEDYDKIETESISYFLGSINHNRKYYQSGNFVSYLANERGNLIISFNGTKLDIIPIERFMLRTNKSFCRETHT